MLIWRCRIAQDLPLCRKGEILGSSKSNLRRVARILQTAERFVKIEMHPAVYISVVAVNLCMVFVYRELSTPVVQHEKRRSIASPMDRHDTIKMANAELIDTQWIEKLPAIARPNTLPELEKPEPRLEIIANKSAGAALAVVPAKTQAKPQAKPRKKSRRSSSFNGLVPPPPPGVMVVPPPPDAPSLFAAVAGKPSLLVPLPVPAPPPMVLGGDCDYPQAQAAPRVAHSRKSGHSDYGDRFNGDRSKTVTHGNYKRVIVSR